MLRIILIVLTVLFSTSAYGETYIDGVVGSIIYKGFAKQDVNSMMAGIRAVNVLKISDSLNVRSEGSLMYGQKEEVRYGIALYQIQPYMVTLRAGISLESDDAVMFTVGPMWRYFYAPVDIKFSGGIPDTSDHYFSETWYAVESMRFLGISGPYRIEFLGEVFIPISQKYRRIDQEYVAGEWISHSRTEHSNGGMGGALELRFGYKSITIDGRYEYFNLSHSSGANLLTFGIGYMF
jgi:hypothetical protein